MSVMNYNRDKVLGRGIFGVVFEGTFGNMKVAVKRIQLLDCKPQEESTMGEFEHENVLRLIHVEKNDDFKFLVLERCQATVSDYVKGTYQGEMPPEPNAFHQMASGLNYIHGKGFVHRDIKPANVLISTTFPITLKISDFGYCKPISPNQSFSVTDGQPKGTRIYFAPEYLQVKPKTASDETASDETASDKTVPEVENVRANVSVDVFSLGCVFFNYATKGDHLFAKPGSQNLTSEHVTENIRTGSKFLRDNFSKLKCSHFAFEMIDWMTQAKPDDRWKLERVINTLNTALETY